MRRKRLTSLLSRRTRRLARHAKRRAIWRPLGRISRALWGNQPPSLEEFWQSRGGRVLAALPYAVAAALVMFTLGEMAALYRLREHAKPASLAPPDPLDDWQPPPLHMPWRHEIRAL